MRADDGFHAAQQQVVGSAARGEEQWNAAKAADERHHACNYKLLCIIK
jgi:hypothetical protein